MSNTTYTTGNELVWLLTQVYLNKVKSNSIKDAHPVLDSNLNCEKVCVNYTNGDTIEFTVDDENNSACATLILNQKETNSDKPIKGKVIYQIHKWPDEGNTSQISEYLAKLIYIIKDALGWYETGKFTMYARICTAASNI